ncbi:MULTISPECIES: hypothetical protein [Rhodococcus]|uniref:Uncharacterized protein n=2 Tax=Rhodococcus TaxID=1827 RepID=A0A1H4IH64_9NOCA|nr:MULTISPECIES: hypothetical protein [Rhodococcus]GCE38252.1 hypothetical protein Rhow_001291 [Rhodococcus wratislaviensis]SEB33431.1 hypothetical protein SAMN04490239_0728 [Rhodococcus koreensis]
MRVRRTRIKAGEALVGWSPGQGSHRVGGIGRTTPTVRPVVEGAVHASSTADLGRIRRSRGRR